MADEGHVPTNAADTPSAMLQPMQPVVPVTSALPDAHVSQAQSQAQVSAGVPAAVVGALPVFPSASGATAGTTGSFPASVSMPALAPMGLGAVGNPALAPSLLQGPVGEAWLAGGSNAAALANFAQMGSRKAPYYEDTDRPRGAIGKTVAEMTPDELERRRAQNRKWAQASRARKKERMHVLEARCKELEAGLAFVSRHITELATENGKLKTALMLVHNQLQQDSENGEAASRIDLTQILQRANLTLQNLTQAPLANALTQPDPSSTPQGPLQAVGGPLGMFGLPAAGNLGMQADGGAAFGGAAQSIGGLPTSLPMSAGATLPMSAGAALPIGTVSLPLAVGGSVPAEGLGDLGLGAKQEDGDGAGGDDGSGR